MADNMIQIKNVSKWYGAVQVLHDCNLSVDKGDVVVVCGPSGSGKSTLIKTINALEPVQKGEIIVNGIAVTAPGTDLPRLRSKVGMVFQHFELFPHLSVTENPTPAPASVRGRAPDEANPRAHQRRGQTVPGDGILQVVVGQVDDGDAADRQPARVGPGVGVDADRHDSGTGGQARGGGHLVAVLPVEDVLRDVVVGKHHRGLAVQRVAGEPRYRHRARDLPLRSFRRVLEVIGNEAAIDEDEAAIIELQRRVDIETGNPFPGGEEMPLALVQEGARDRDGRVVDVTGAGELALERGKRRRRFVRTLVYGLKETFLPLQTLDLPGAEPDQNKEHDKAEPEQQGHARPRGAGGRTSRPAHSPVSSLPSEAFPEYCKVISTPLKAVTEKLPRAQALA